MVDTAKEIYNQSRLERLFSLTIGRRIHLITAVTMAGLILLILTMGNAVATSTNDGIDRGIRQVVESAVPVASYYQKQEAAGLMSKEQAQAAAIAALKTLRYNSSDYVWINDMAPKMVMHPTKPQLDGTDLSANADPTAKLLFIEMVNVVKADGAGYVSYKWPKPGQDEPVDKTSYVASLKEWGWIIGSGVYLDEAQAQVNKEILSTLKISAAILFAVFVVALLITRSITKPLNAIEDSMSRIANGDVTAAVPHVDRHDEIGMMARTLSKFRESSIRVIQLERSARENESKLAEEKKKQAEDISEQFERSVGGILNSVSNAVFNLREQVGRISRLAETNRQMAEDAQTTVAHASRNVQVVAASAEQLSTSINEINDQIGRSRRMNESINGSVQKTAQEVRHLTDAAEKVSNVVELINDISTRTNLLALNATIEAARAGEAGKGFAIVSSEVKALANQTNGATENISHHISEMTGAVDVVSKAVEVMDKSISENNRVTSTIASAIEQQHSATQGIAQTISEVANSTEKINRNIDRVNHSSHETEDATKALAKSTDDLNDNTRKLKDSIQSFLKAIA